MMASCSVPDVPAVMVVLEHLEKLDNQLREAASSLSQEAGHHLRGISAAVRELEASRKAVHEAVEVETIETSKLRHQALTLRDDISNEMSACVAAARNENAAELDQLQADLKTITEDIESMKNKQKFLDDQNAVLLPERELVKGHHENVIDQLNHQLSQRTNKQILLNEMRHEIRTVRERIVQVETGKEELMENLIQERAKFHKTKEKLKQEIEESIHNIQEKRKSNGMIRMELDIVTSELRDKEDKVTDLRNLIAQLEGNISRLTKLQNHHKEQIDAEVKKMEELYHQKEFHDKELLEVQKAFEEKIQVLQEKITEVEREIQTNRIVNGIRLASVSKISGRFDAQREEEDKARAEHQRLSKQLRKSKLRLEEQIASIVRCKTEIREMEEQMKRLHETNLVNDDLFQRNFEELEGQLAKEKKNRAALEVEKDQFSESFRNLKEKHEQHMKEVKSVIQLSQKKYSDLREEEKEIQDHVSMCSMIEALTKQVLNSEEDKKQMEMAYHTEIQQLSTEAESLTQARLDMEERLKAQRMMLEEVEAQFDRDHSRHQALKKSTTELQTIKRNLELSIQEVIQQTTALLKPKDELKQELETVRKTHMEMLISDAAEIRSIERRIYEDGVVLEQVNMENSRLHLCIEQMKGEIHNAKTQKEKHIQDIKWLKKEVQSLYRGLSEAWATDTVVTEQSVERDEKTLEAIHNLEMKIRERMLHIGDINAGLGKELEGMSCVFKRTIP